MIQNLVRRDIRLAGSCGEDFKPFIGVFLEHLRCVGVNIALQCGGVNGTHLEYCMTKTWLACSDKKATVCLTPSCPLSKTSSEPNLDHVSRALMSCPLCLYNKANALYRLWETKNCRTGAMLAISTNTGSMLAISTNAMQSKQASHQTGDFGHPPHTQRLFPPPHPPPTLHTQWLFQPPHHTHSGCSSPPIRGSQRVPARNHGARSDSAYPQRGRAGKSSGRRTS